MTENSRTHTHVMEDGTVVEHSHLHTHTHTHQNTKAVLNRLSRAIGHLESIKRMVEDGRDCSEVLIQLSAVKAAINNTGKVILQDHIEHCIVDAIESGDRETLKELQKAIDRVYQIKRKEGETWRKNAAIHHVPKKVVRDAPADRRKMISGPG